MNLSASLARGNWATASRLLTPALKLRAAPTDTSRSRATCSASPKIHATATAWSACFTTPSSARGPIQADGTSFYYSDYADTGKKVWYGQKWPCCSGTFPQLAADYHISTYLRAADGVYVNLFTPSTLNWSDGGGRYGLKQETRYPFDNKIQIQVSGSQARDYTLYVRIPGWAAPDPVLSVNGKRVSDPVQPGTFAAIRRTWKDGDRVELELPMPLRLEQVDVNHPKLVALVQGPLVLFAVADSQPSFDRNALLQAKPANNAKGDWLVSSADGSSVSMRPFMNIDKENYSAYVLLKS